MAAVTYAAVADDIGARPAPALPRLVAVDGLSGSGKSTFATKLAVALNGAPVVEIDDFVSWNNFAGWWSRLEAQVLGPLLAGSDATYQQRDWQADPLGEGLGEWRTVPAAPIVILEGVTSSRRAIADRLTLAVWVDAPAELRLRRGLQRDGEARRSRWLEWMTQEDTFFAQDRTQDRAHLLVDGSRAIISQQDHEFFGALRRANPDGRAPSRNVSPIPKDSD